MTIKKKEKYNTCYDKSNAYKLPKEEFEKIKKNPLLEFDDNRKKYAEKLYKRIINTGNMPYVLLINDSFGMGKTYFITRFSLYLYQKDIDSIYISVKEQDYINDSDEKLIHTNHPLSIKRIEEQQKLLSFSPPDFIESGYNLRQYYNRFKSEYINIVGNDCIETIEKLDSAIDKLENEKGSIINENYYDNLHWVNESFREKLIELYSAKRDEIKKFYEEWQIETDENELKEKYDRLFR